MGFLIKKIEFALPKNYEKNNYLKLKNKLWKIADIEKKNWHI